MLRDAVQAVLHPADAMLDAAQGHGTVPGDVMLGGAAYGAYKGGSKAYAAYQARGATQVAEAAPEVEESTGVLEAIEGVDGDHARGRGTSRARAPGVPVNHLYFMRMVNRRCSSSGTSACCTSHTSATTDPPSRDFM